MEEIEVAFVHSLSLLQHNLITALFFLPLRWTNGLHGPRLLHPESLSEQPAVSGLPGPSSGHSAEPVVPAPGPLLLRPRQDACGAGKHPYAAWGKPVQLQVCQENAQTQATTGISLTNDTLDK